MAHTLIVVVGAMPPKLAMKWFMGNTVAKSIRLAKAAVETAKLLHADICINSAGYEGTHSWYLSTKNNEYHDEYRCVRCLKYANVTDVMRLLPGYTPWKPLREKS